MECCTQIPRLGTTRYYTWRYFLVLAISTSTASCASIQHFSVSPRSACSSDTVLAVWSASGTVSLTSTPILAGTGAQPSQGEKKFVVKEPTHFILTATRLFGSKHSEADVNVAPHALGYGEIAMCSASEHQITAHLTLNNQISPSFMVAAVRNPLNRTLRVSKSGHTVDIEAHGEALLRNVPASGVWLLSSPLNPSETCNSAMHSIRQRLEMQLVLMCGR